MGHLRSSRINKNLKHCRIESQIVIGPTYQLREALTAKPINELSKLELNKFFESQLNFT